MSNPNTFSNRLLAWFDLHGRKDLPWQHPATPYRVWVSEIMLQQTQVATVIPYFIRFMARFPELHLLASADQAEVLTYWSGLGYYARGRNLHQSAQKLVQSHDGALPDTAEALLSLPGIGQSTAHAILSLAYHQPKAICDGNVRRVLARWLALEVSIDKPQGRAQLWQTAQALQSLSRPADYTQAMMDLGATLCTRSKPKCGQCPVREDCQALHQAETEGVVVTRYPLRSQKSDKPTKHCVMYLLQHPDGAVWLEAPQKMEGLWGGLYQLPQTLPEGLSAMFVQQGISLTQLKETQHVFTHFKLVIQPYWVKLSLAQASELPRLFAGQTLADKDEVGREGAWHHQTQPLPRPAIVDKLLQLIAPEV